MTASDALIRRELIYASLGFPRLYKSESASIRRSVVIALLDGTIDSMHPAFASISISQHGHALPSEHATAMASLIVGAQSGRGQAGIKLLSWPTLDDHQHDLPADEPARAQRIRDHLAHACALNVDLIVLGFEFLSRSTYFLQCVSEALATALHRAIPVLVPAGNHGGIADHPLLMHPAVLPIAMTDLTGALSPVSAWGPAVASRGLRAPGQSIPVALTGGRFGSATGTSFAAALATAGFGALYARRPEPARRICSALQARTSRTPPALHGTRTVPPAFDVWIAYQSLSDNT